MKDASFQEAIEELLALIEEDNRVAEKDLRLWEDAGDITQQALEDLSEELLPDLTPATLQHLHTIAPAFFFARTQKLIASCSRGPVPALVSALIPRHWYLGGAYRALLEELRRLIWENKVASPKAQQVYVSASSIAHEISVATKDAKQYMAYKTRLLRMPSDLNVNLARTIAASNVLAEASDRRPRKSRYPAGHTMEDPQHRTIENWHRWILHICDASV